MKEILKEKSAASFYRKVMAYMQKYDNNFSKLSSYFQKTETGDRLKMGKPHFACCVDSLPKRKSDYDASVTWTYDEKSYCLYLEFTREELESAFIPKFNIAYTNDFSIKKNGDEYILLSLQQDVRETMDKNDLSDIIQLKDSFVQKIFFGAPGTGKSYKVNSILAKQRKDAFMSSDTAKSNHYAEVLSDNNYVDCNIWMIDNFGLLEKKLATFESDDKRANPRHSALRAYIDFFKKYREENRENRTTFHPDYDYAQFVGAYKPKKEGNAITYSFVPQVFAKAYAAAWKQYFAAGNASTANNQVYLVIEEINRGNCAQIFGDIFQLLDRDGDGFSQYSIDADCDFAKWLETDEKGLKFVWDKYKETVGEGKLKLPPNLNILATMNTSDQSLFPMDGAFKRRFDWEYVPISFDGKDAANFQIDIDGTQYSWQKFVETVNEKILTLTESEDKQLGEFFIKPDSGNVISKDRFLGKVMFYLWNEVCKDEHKNGSFFRTKDGDKEKYFTFQDLYRDKGLLKRFIEKLFEKGPSRE